MPYTTLVAWSCPMVSAPALRIFKRPSAPSPPMPVKITPTARDAATSATDSNSTSTDGTWPEDEIERMRDLYNVNESVNLLCALTDLILDEDDRVVITGIDFPSTPGIEDGQVIRIECTTDKPFELIVE